MNPKVKEITNYIYKNIFGVDNPYSLDQLKKKFAIDIPTAKKVKCSLLGIDTWSFFDEDKIASQQAIDDRYKQDEWMRKRKSLNSIEDVLRAWEEISYLTGEKYVSSTDIAESDGVYNSNLVYHSVSIFDSKNIIFCYKIFDCNYMLTSRDNASCTLGMRVKESIFCSSSFEVSWSNKISKSMFVHDGFDLYECLYCSHLRSKKYCIANMQFEKEEYFKIKKLVVDWIINV